MNDSNRGFFDDFDDEAPTQFNSQQGAPPPNMPPSSPYDPAEAETRLPHNNPGQQPPPPAYQNQQPPPYNPAQDPTRLPGQSGYGRPQGGNVYDPLEGETSLGEEMNVGPLGFLIVKRPLQHRGHVHRLPQVCDIGRRAGHILLHDRRVSARHARIRQMEDPETGTPIFMLIDMDSKTGTFVNDSTETVHRVRLEQGDEVKLGDHVFVFMMLLD